VKQLRAQPKQPRGSSKSQPFDAEDLCRRLVVVLAEQETLEKTRLTRFDTDGRKEWEERHASHQQGARSKKSRSRTEYLMYQEEMARLKAKTKADHEARKSVAKPPRPDAKRQSQEPYHHVPSVAALQFKKTATRESMVGGGGSVRYSFGNPSVAAEKRGSHQLRLQEGLRKRDATLHRSTSVETPRNRRPRRRRSSMGDMPEKVMFRRYPSTDKCLSTDEDSFEDTLIPDLAAAQEHRVDWTQSDETHRKQKTRVLRFYRGEVILTLKARLGNLSRHKADVKITEAGEPQDEPSSPVSPRSRRGIS
jgi:hypothetical protein